MALPEPFGILLLLAAIAGSFVVGSVIAIAGRKSGKGLFTGIGIMAAPWMLLVLLIMSTPGIDEWNPTLSSDAAAWGDWEGDGYLIKLNADSTFTAKLKQESITGNWRRMDFNVYLVTADGNERYMRFVEDSGRLLLLPDPPRDESPRPGPVTRKK